MKPIRNRVCVNFHYVFYNSYIGSLFFGIIFPFRDTSSNNNEMIVLYICIYTYIKHNNNKICLLNSHLSFNNETCLNNKLLPTFMNIYIFLRRTIIQMCKILNN